MIRNAIMIHHSLTADSGTVSWAAIRKYHTQEQHWLDIGYHYGIELVDGDYEVLIGRPETMVAAACKEGKQNELAIHVCCVGNYDTIEPPARMLEVLTSRLLLPLTFRYKISPGAIVGHRDYATYKSCPGTKFNLTTVRSMVWKQLG